jgi:carbon-monoxide dehydrogenase medium subunit
MTIDALPELPEFDYIKPANLAEASRFLAQHGGEARPLLGGTDIFVRMRDGIWRDKFLVDVKGLDGTDEMHYDAQLGLSVGSAVNMNRVLSSTAVQEYYPLLAEACRSVASYQLRTRATVVGNVCNASPAGDTIGACLVLGGILKVHGVDGYRQVPLSGFFLGPGKTVLKPGDIATAIQFPKPPPKSAGKYIKLGRNNKSDLAIVGVTVLGYPDASSGSGYQFHISLASVAPVPLVASAAQDYLATHPAGPEAFAQAARLAEEACSPIDDVRGSARYRKAMVRRLTERALNSVWTNLAA